jgi:hypothetical protein
MGVGLACCEAVLWFYRRRANQRRSQAPTIENLGPARGR